VSNSEQDNASPFQIFSELKTKILETTTIKDQRIHQAIDQRVENELSKDIKSFIRQSLSEDEQIHLKSQERIKIHSSLIQNYEFMNQT
jgi:hypothetical protein